MRFLLVLMMIFLTGCQFSINRNSGDAPGNIVRSGTHAFENGSIRVFGKSWGDYGRSLAQAAAYQKLYKAASRTGHTHFYIDSVKNRHVERGKWSLLPLATKANDYHSVRLQARLYKGSKGTPQRALRIEWLRQQIENGDVRSNPPRESLRETIIRRKVNTKARSRPKKVAAKPVKKPVEVQPKPVPTEKPLVIKAPES